MPAPPKLTAADVVEIRRRVGGGEQVSVLAEEFGVNRKTVRRRLDALERAEREEAERIAGLRLKRQVARELRKLRQREVQVVTDTLETAVGERGRPSRGSDYEEWLDMPKNLGGRTFAGARGLVKMRTPDGTFRGWVERADVERRLEEGWLLD